jgi:hypothetical protein
MILVTSVRRIDPAAPRTKALINTAARELFEARTRQVAPAHPDYRLGEKIAFTTTGTGKTYTRAGWIGPEVRHTWMQGDESWVSIDPDVDDPAIQNAGGLVLTIELRPLVVKGRLDAQRCTIQVNGVEILSRSFDGPAEVSCRIPADAALRQRPIRISFQHPDAARPADLIEASSDRKLLAFAVSTMRLNLAEEPAGA